MLHLGKVLQAHQHARARCYKPTNTHTATQLVCTAPSSMTARIQITPDKGVAHDEEHGDSRADGLRCIRTRRHAAH